MDKSSIELIFMFFNCTMARDIPQMGKILKLYILEILGHPNRAAHKFSRSGELQDDLQTLLTQQSKLSWNPEEFCRESVEMRRM